MVAVLVALTAITLATGAALAGSGDERAKIDLFAAPLSVAPGATGEAELRLRGDRGEFEFEAKVEGLTPGWIVSFCLNDILIDTENVEDQGRVELDEDDPGDLIPQGEPVSILGQVTIREGSSCAGNVLLEGFASQSDLE